MRCAKQGAFVRIGGRHFCDDFAAEQDDRPVAHKPDFRQLGSKQQHRRPGIGHLAQQPIDLMLGPDIDAGSRVKAKQSLKSGRHPSRDHHLLLVAAAEPAHFRSRAGVDLQPLDGGGDAFALAAGRDEAPIDRVADKRQSHVLADRALRQESLKAVRRDEHEAGRDCIARVVQLQLSAARQDLPAALAAHPGNAIEQLPLPLSFKRRNAENLSGPKAEGYIAEHGAIAEIADLERRLFSRAAIDPPNRGLDGSGFHDVRAQHQRNDSILVALGGVGDADEGAIAQHRGAIAERGNLGDAMRDEDHRASAFPPATDDREHSFRQIRGKSGGDLVQHEHDGR